MSVRRVSMSLLFWVLLCVGGGAIVGFLTAGGDSAWYQTIAKPSWTPPSSVFAPVWTTLYAMMGVSAWLIFRRDGWRRNAMALVLFLSQLFLNFAWSFIFFTAQNLDLALAEIILLLILIIITLWKFGKIDRRAGWLLVPYCLWVSFATVLTASIAYMN